MVEAAKTVSIEVFLLRASATRFADPALCLSTKRKLLDVNEPLCVLSIQVFMGLNVSQRVMVSVQDEVLVASGLSGLCGFDYR